MPKSENELRQEIAEAEFDYQCEKRANPTPRRFDSDTGTSGVSDKDYTHITKQTQRRLELERLQHENTTDRNRTTELHGSGSD